MWNAEGGVRNGELRDRWSWNVPWLLVWCEFLRVTDPRSGVGSRNLTMSVGQISLLKLI